MGFGLVLDFGDSLVIRQDLVVAVLEHGAAMIDFEDHKDDHVSGEGLEDFKEVVHCDAFGYLFY